MSRYFPSLRASASRFAAAVFVLALLFGSFIDVTTTNAKNLNELGPSFREGTPGFEPPSDGDDDQPTIRSQPGRRSTVAVTETGDGGGHSSDDSQLSGFNMVRRALERGQIAVKIALRALRP